MGLTSTSGLSVGGGLSAGGGLSRSGGFTPGALTPSVSAWAAAVVAAGGSVSANRALIVNQFVLAEMASGAWTLTDDYWPFWAENAAQASVSLKQLRAITLVAAPTFTVDRQYAFNGTSNYVNTGFIPTTHCVAASGSAIRVGVYERTNTNSSGIAIGGGTAVAAETIQLVPRQALAATSRLTSATTASFTLTTPNPQGFIATSRAGSTTQLAYQRGVRQTDATGIVAGNVLPSVVLYIGARNSNGTAANFRVCSVGLACLGAPLSDAQELAQYNNVQAWAAAIGAAV